MSETINIYTYYHMIYINYILIYVHHGITHGADVFIHGCDDRNVLPVYVVTFTHGRY